MIRPLALAVAVVVAAGCGLLRRHATPEQLAALPPERRDALQDLERERVAATTRWQLATRQRQIAAQLRDAAELRRRVMPDMAAWYEARRGAAGSMLLDDDERALAACAGRAMALARVHDAEALLAADEWRVARAAEAEARRRYDWRVAEEERARLAAVLDRPGVPREDLDRQVGRWDRAVATARRAADVAMIERRSAEQRVILSRKGLDGTWFKFQRDHAAPCPVDVERPAAPPPETLAGDTLSLPTVTPSVMPAPASDPSPLGGDPIGAALNAEAATAPPPP